jgi:hypothetical protein
MTGAIAASSDHTIASYIMGSNGLPPKPWNDILYDYFLANYAAATPPRGSFDAQNEPPNPKDTYHVYVSRGTIRENTRLGAYVNTIVESYVFGCYVKQKTMAEFTPHLNNIVDEVRRIFIREYESHAIAGIKHFNNLVSGGIIPPETAFTPFANMWMIPVEISCEYNIKTLINPKAYPISDPYQGYRYPAGYFTLLPT